MWLFLLSCSPEVPSTPGNGVDSKVFSDCEPGKHAVDSGAPKHCVGMDENCNGVVDEQDVDATTWYADRDRDSFGDASSFEATCSLLDGFVAEITDNGDRDATISPTGAENCADGLHQDCSGSDRPCPAWTGSWTADDNADARICGLAEAGDFGFGLEGEDFNGDGLGDLIVGDGEWDAESRRGAIFGYSGPFVGGEWASTENVGLLITHGHLDFEGAFGNHLEKVGDLNLDGAEDFIAVLDVVWIWLGG